MITRSTLGRSCAFLALVSAGATGCGGDGSAAPAVEDVPAFDGSGGGQEAGIRGLLEFDDAGCATIDGVPLAFADHLRVGKSNDTGEWTLVNGRDASLVGRDGERMDFGGSERRADDVKSSSINAGVCDYPESVWLFIDSLD